MGVCDPETTLISPTLPVTGAPSTSGVPLKDHTKLKGPVPETAVDKVSFPPTLALSVAAGFEVKVGAVGVVLTEM
jgi:hypothetical protein